jgi:hypothetical protein
MKFNSLSLCLSAFILLASCTKEKLPAPGIDQSGNTSAPSAFIVASPWVSESLIWSEDPADSDNSLKAIFGSNLTQEMLDNGVVLIYAKDQSSGAVNSFPALFDLNDTEYDSYSCEVEPNAIKLAHSCYRSGQFITPVKNDNVSFRYIFVGNTTNVGHYTNATSGTHDAVVEVETSGGTRILLKDLKHMDYNFVVSLLGINK